MLCWRYMFCNLSRNMFLSRNQIWHQWLNCPSFSISERSFLQVWNITHVTSLYTACMRQLSAIYLISRAWRICTPKIQFTSISHPRISLLKEEKKWSQPISEFRMSPVLPLPTLGTGFERLTSTSGQLSVVVTSQLQYMYS